MDRPATLLAKTDKTAVRASNGFLEANGWFCPKCKRWIPWSNWGVCPYCKD